ncbi:hypothetical protein HJFPF1_13055 [Paramyrothecium foliicola]|nr:hypothetical protein HJFPF1_13055 [Paramyrothecium foliicola]
MAESKSFVAGLTSSEVPLNTQCTFVKPLPQPTLGNKGSASIVNSTHIAAPPLKCLEIVLDTNAYPKWNRFARRVVIERQSTATSADLPASLSHLASGKDQLLPGAEFIFECHMDIESDASRNVDLMVTLLQDIIHEGRPGFRVSWKTHKNNWLVNAERTQDFILASDGGTEYYNKETFYGLIGHAFQWLIGSNLKKSVDSWKDTLKKEAEAQSGTSGN